MVKRLFILALALLLPLRSHAQGYRVSEPLRDSVVVDDGMGGREVRYTFQTEMPKVVSPDSIVSSKTGSGRRQLTEEEMLAAQDAEASRMAGEASDRIPSEGSRITYDVGSIPFDESISPTGARVYSIPIATAAGWKLTPGIALVYNSQAGNDVAGFGWGIAGLPCIRVRNKNLYYDGTIAGGIFDSFSSSYSLDGIPIVTSDMGISGYTLATARGKIQIQKHATSSGRILYFTALYPDGSTAVFGFTDATAPQSTYPLTSLTDIEGNTLTVSYATEGNSYYVTQVSYGTNASILFTYTSRADDTPYRYAFAGQLVEYPKKLLSTITSKDGSTTICQYGLTYENEDDTYLLKQLDCTSGSGHLPPLQFTYGIDLETVTPTPTFTQEEQYSYPDSYTKSSTLLLQHHRGRFIPGNLNDGIVILPSYDTYAVVAQWLNPLTGTVLYKYRSIYPADQKILCNFVNGNGSPVQKTILTGDGFQLIEAMDVDGDGVDELVKINHSSTTSGITDYTITIYSFDSNYNYTSSNFFTVSVNDGNSNMLYTNPAKSYYRFGNFRGDGKPMLLIMTREASKFALVDLNTQTKLSESTLFTMDDDEDNLVLAADFEGDGKTDLCHITGTDLKTYNLSSASSTSFSSGSNYSGVSRPLLYKKDYGGSTIQELKARLFVLDINGDGYLDIAAAPGLNFDTGSLTTNDVWNIARFNGKQFTTEQDVLLFRNRDDTVIFLDADKDGLTDMLHLRETDLLLLPNRAGEFSLIYEDTELPLNSSTDIIPGYPLSFDGTLGDVMTVDGRYDRLYSFGINRGGRRRLRLLTDSAGIVHNNSYSPIGGDWSIYQEDTGRSYNWSSGFTRSRYSFYVLSGTLASMNGQTVRSDSYTYTDAIYHYRGLGFCGFGKICTRDLVDTVYTTRTLNPEKFGIVEQEVSAKTLNGNPFSTTVNTWDNHSTTYGKLDPRLTKSIQTDALTGIKTTSSYSYGTYDFPSSITIDRQIGSGAIKKTILQWTYQHSVTASKYKLGVITQESVAKDVDGSTSVYWKEKSLFTYDTCFRPLTEKRYVGPSNVFSGGSLDANNLVSETRWQYDSHGNVTSEETAPYNATTFTGSTYTYDTDGRYILTETDALGHTTTYSSYNKWGKPATVKDYRQRTTSYSYDAWGRETSVSRPGSLTEQTTRAWGGSGLYTVTRTVTGRPQAIVHYDALGREVRSGEKRFDAQWQYTDRQYDGKGRLWKVSLPFRGSSASYWNTYQYDAYNRPTRLTGPTGKTSTWSYSGTSVTTVKDGVSSTSTKNANGQVVSVTDAGGTITYTLRDDGQPSAITAPGNVQTTFAYDDYGRRTTLSDPSAGTQTDAYQWNSDGSSMFTHTNPNGTVKTYRDRYGRTTLVERTGEYNTTYTYNTYGLLSTVQSTNGTGTEFTYDSVDRLSTVKETVPDSKWLKKTFTYTNGNVLTKTLYTTQDGNITTETYTYANGHQTKTTITDGTVVWQLTSENDLGQPTGVTTGTVSREYSYSAASGLPSYRRMAQGALQNFSYMFNAQTGNLQARQDIVHSQSESFSYDSMNRLTSMGSRSISYNSKGNILSIGGVGSMAYGNSSKPYQVTALTPASNDLVPDRTQSVTYTSYNRPSTLSDGGRTAIFTYNGDGDRVKMQVTDNTGTLLTRYYVGGQYEMDLAGSTTTQRLYLGGDAYSAPMVYQKVGSGSWTAYNIGRDYLGSITHIATKTGTLVAEYSYDPWGRLRNPSTLAIYTPGNEPDLFLGRGFTGHEHLTWFGLINMNARLYDPLLGRFLSPDPFVQAPDFSQAFNRYSYALNNPLRYTDPDGEWLHIVIGAVAGGIGSLLANWNSCEGFWEFFTAFGVGAAAGAAIAATGGAAAAAGGGFWATAGVIGVGTAGGAANGATSEIIKQTGPNFDGIDTVDWERVGLTAAVSGVAGGVGTGVGVAMSGVHFSISINGVSIQSPILSSFVTGSVASGAGQVVGGTFTGLLTGESLQDAFLKSLYGIGPSMLVGGAFSLASTAAYSMVNGINPWTGKPLSFSDFDLVNASDLGLQVEVERIKNGTIYSRYRHDGTIFMNAEGYLPGGVNYTEYVVPPIAGYGPGPCRIVVGSDNNWYYTPDHYRTFFHFIP